MTSGRAPEAEEGGDVSWLAEQKPRGWNDHQALTLFQATGHRGGQAHALNAVGWDHARLGDDTQALTYCQQARTLCQQTGNRDGEAATWASLGYAHHHLHQHTQAQCQVEEHDRVVGACTGRA